MFDNSDDYDFTPTESSKLASLFGSPPTLTESNQSLMYTAPKQPKTTVKSPDLNELVKSKPTSSQTSVLSAKIVTLWKLDNNKYSALGKHGLAIIGSTVQNAYEIIIYKEKHNVLIRVKLNENFSFFNQNDNFSTFYDQFTQNWLLKFDTALDQKDFSEQIELYGGKIVDNTKNQPQKEQEENVLEKESEAQTRADILTRMAKMGQQILPGKLPQKESTDLSDSELDESSGSDRKIVPVPRKFKRVIQPVGGTSEINQCQVTQQQLVGVNSQVMQHFPHHVAMDSFGFVVAQNSELKANLAQISSKLDAVLTGRNQQVSGEDSGARAKLKAMELRTSNLLSELGSCQKRYHNLEEKYTQLLQEKSENLELSTSLENAKVLETDLELCKNEIKLLQKTVEEQKLKLHDLTVFYEENKDNDDLRETVETLRASAENLRLKQRDFEDYFSRNELEKQQRAVEDKEKLEQFTDLIKSHMNDMYQDLVKNFDDNCDYSSAKIQSCIARNVKSSTYKVIQDLKGLYAEGTKKLTEE